MSASPQTMITDLGRAGASLALDLGTDLGSIRSYGGSGNRVLLGELVQEAEQKVARINAYLRDVRGLLGMSRVSTIIDVQAEG